MTSISVKPAVELQAWLTTQWDRACAWLDKGEPIGDKFHASMKRFWQAAARFEAVEASTRRAGHKGCLSTPEVCAGAVVACQACKTEGSDKSFIVDSKQGHSKNGDIWLIERLSI